MVVAKTVSEAQSFLSALEQKGQSIGFVPTMGALHQGHISLIQRAKMENDLVVCSIFVNPAQFNDPNDLMNYPRTPEADRILLDQAGCGLLFEPTEKEIYPEELEFHMDFGQLERVMEGQYRTGHFKGVAKVVSRLFEIVKPDRAYFGEKDFQQLAIITEMNRRKGYSVKIIGCPTLRDERGLALSSRNIHLTNEEFLEAPIIYKTLQSAKGAIQKYGVEEARSRLIGEIEKGQKFFVQYLEFVDSSTLVPISFHDESKSQRACIAVLTSKTRLIDNIAI